MTEHDVREFTEPCLVRQLRERRDSDRPLARVPLAVAVGPSEGFLDDAEGVERPAPIPRGDRQRFQVLAVGLAEYEPARPVDEPRERLDVIGVGLRCVCRPIRGRLALASPVDTA